jgi:hypothetical protein
MRNWLSRIIRWFRALLDKIRDHREILGVKFVEEIDKDRLKTSLLYVESRGGKDRWLHLRCPCGCGDVISLNLMTSNRPFWSLTRHTDGTLSVMPSVDKTSGCRSHFFIRQSRIAWAGQGATN